jgi:glycerol kinase
VPVVRPSVTETTALGAAYLAGLQIGFWRGTDDVARHWHEEARFAPSIERTQRDERMRTWHRAVECARGWARP